MVLGLIGPRRTCERDIAQEINQNLPELDAILSKSQGSRIAPPKLHQWRNLVEEREERGLT